MAMTVGLELFSGGGIAITAAAVLESPGGGMAKTVDDGWFVVGSVDFGGEVTGS